MVDEWMAMIRFKLSACRQRKCILRTNGGGSGSGGGGGFVCHSSFPTILRILWHATGASSFTEGGGVEAGDEERTKTSLSSSSGSLLVVLSLHSSSSSYTCAAWKRRREKKIGIIDFVVVLYSRWVVVL